MSPRAAAVIAAAAALAAAQGDPEDGPAQRLRMKQLRAEQDEREFQDWLAEQPEPVRFFHNKTHPRSPDENSLIINFRDVPPGVPGGLRAGTRIGAEFVAHSRYGLLLVDVSDEGPGAEAGLNKFVGRWLDSVNAKQVRSRPRLANLLAEARFAQLRFNRKIDHPYPRTLEQVAEIRKGVNVTSNGLLELDCCG
eukprot:TRINITY_DN61371_c0_g1_i1.p1 TRINITY_DN61371_c0_g1~~TRINITY_DN61371_c0_g1_i1.p1  ORF type:complete len:194 (+),score=56.91 TRINITY_DN61371_c0_g1_i1:84-665(+)